MNRPYSDSKTKVKVDGGDVQKSGGVTTAFPARPSSELQRIMSRVSSE